MRNTRNTKPPNSMKIVHKNTKTITESDNNLFCLLTMNPHPVHLNVEYAKNAKHGKILVVGTLTFSLAVGLTVPEISFDAIANLEYSDIKHVNPVFLGDTIRVKSYVKRAIRGSKEIWDVESTVYNQDDKIVLTFCRKVLKTC